MAHLVKELTMQTEGLVQSLESVVEGCPLTSRVCLACTHVYDTLKFFKGNVYFKWLEW